MPIDQFSMKEKVNALPPSCFTLADLEKLYDIFEEINKAARTLHLSVLEKQPQETDEEFAKRQEGVDKWIYKTHVRVWGETGSMQLFRDREGLSETNLPDSLNGVQFDNYNPTQIEPAYKVSISLNARKPPFFDFFPNTTSNTSLLQVKGFDSNWVEGSYTNISNWVKSRRSFWSFIHAKAMYDLYLWLLIMPITLYLLGKFSLSISPFMANTSLVYQISVHVYFVIICMTIGYLGFNYVRWTYPFIEYIPNKKKFDIHKYIVGSFGLSLLGLMGNAVREFLIKFFL